MNLKYMPEIDTLFIYLKPEVEKILIPSSSVDEIGIFVDKKTRKIICGYEIENASSVFFENINTLNFSLRDLVASGMYFLRMSNGYSQEKMASDLGISLSSYKKMEKGNQNFTMDMFELVYTKFPTLKNIIADNLMAS